MNPIEDKAITTATPPVQVAVIGTGDGLVQGTTAKTPSDQPNIIVSVVSPARAILIRFIYLFLTILVGLLVAAMTPAGAKVLYTGDFLDLLQTCSSLSFPGAALGFLKDLVTIFGRLEGKYPLLTGG